MPAFGRVVTPSYGSREALVFVSDTKDKARIDRAEAGLGSAAGERLGIEEDGFAGDRRGAVDEEDELLRALVPDLERGVDVDGDDVARPGLDELGRLPDRQRERAGEDDEDLLLGVLDVAAAAGARRVAPDARPRLLEAAGLGHVRGESGLRPLGRGALFEGELGGADDVVAHLRGSSHTRYGLRVLLVVAATEAELRGADGAATLVCGVGPVEAALATARALAERPATAVLHVGIAGARGIEPPTLVLGSEAVYCDVLDPTSTIARVERAEPDAGLLAAARRALPEAQVLPIGTCARVGGGVGGDAGCTVEAMEGFGVLRAAALAGVPALELRAVSNDVDEPDRARWRFADALAALAAALPRLLEELGRA